MKGTGAKRNVCPGSCASTGAKFPVELAPMLLETPLVVFRGLLLKEKEGKGRGEFILCHRKKKEKLAPMKFYVTSYLPVSSVSE